MRYFVNNNSRQPEEMQILSETEHSVVARRKWMGDWGREKRIRKETESQKIVDSWNEGLDWLIAREEEKIERAKMVIQQSRSKIGNLNSVRRKS